MTVHQLPVEVAAFTRWLTELAGRIRVDDGWYAVFAERDPDGLRACFEGTELLPWDVVESLLQDAGEPSGGPAAVHGRALYEAAAAAHDRRPGATRALAERRRLMEDERRYAQTRSRELAERLRAARTPEDVARLEHDLAWTRDDHARAAARTADLDARLAHLARLDGAREPEGPVRGVAAGTVPGVTAGTVPGVAAGAGEAAGPGGRDRLDQAGARPGAAEAPGRGTAAPGRRRPRGARYAWLEEAEEEAAPVPAALLSLPSLPAGGGALRGARFGGAAEAPADPPPGAAASALAASAASAEGARAAADAVHALGRLRAQGRSGDAHALLCEALAGPTARLPALAEELHRAGLAADWATLLWEAASLAPERLAAVAGALADAGRTDDCAQLLRQGVARPVEELAGACAALHAEAHHREAHALLTAFVRVRPPEDAARLAAADPHGLVPQLRAAARAVSTARERDLLHALRVAGLAGA
ncbi:UL36 very large tegument protein [Streptomyces sp. NPDC003327]